MKLFLGFSLIFALVHFTAFSQNELAVVSYNIGVAVKESKNESSKTITMLQAGEVFLSEASNSYWWPVQRFKDRVGYVHINDVKLVKDLPVEEQTFVIMNTLIKMQDYIYSTDSTEENTILRQSFEQSEYFYAVDLIPALYNKTLDHDLLSSFAQVLISNQGPASEISLLTLGQLYINQPELVMNYINQEGDAERAKLKDYLKVGFEMTTFAREDQVENYQILSNNLNFDSNTRLSALADPSTDGNIIH